MKRVTFFFWIIPNRNRVQASVTHKFRNIPGDKNYQKQINTSIFSKQFKIINQIVQIICHTPLNNTEHTANLAERLKLGHSTHISVL